MSDQTYPVTFPDAKANSGYSAIEVDDVVIQKGGEAKDLTQEQIDRLSSLKIKIEVEKSQSGGQSASQTQSPSS